MENIKACMENPKTYITYNVVLDKSVKLDTLKALDL